MMHDFNLRVVASNKVFFEGRCNSITIPMIDGGSAGFLANHENTVTPIKAGELKIVPVEGDDVYAFVGNGFLEFIDNDARIVCISAEKPEDIDAIRAKKAEERAQQELKAKRSKFEQEKVEADLVRAMERLKIKNKHKM